MHARRLIVVAAVAAATIVAPAAAESAGLELTRVTKPPQSVAPGDDFIVKVTVTNATKRVRRGLLKMTIEGGPAYGVPRRIARIPIGAVDPLSFKRFTIRLTVPLDVTPARYRMRTCLKSRGGRECLLSRRINVSG